VTNRISYEDNCYLLICCNTFKINVPVIIPSQICKCITSQRRQSVNNDVENEEMLRTLKIYSLDSTYDKKLSI